MRIAWRGQHQFSLIIAVSQPSRETESAIAISLEGLNLLNSVVVF
ncbi:hypothetical protein [Nostoc sp.]